MENAITTLVLVILAFSALITAVILQEVRLNRVEKRMEKLERGYAELERAYIHTNKDIERLGETVGGMSDIVKETMEAQANADKAWSEAVQDIVGFGKDIPNLTFGGKRDG